MRKKVHFNGSTYVYKAPEIKSISIEKAREEISKVTEPGPRVYLESVLDFSKSVQDVIKGEIDKKTFLARNKKVNFRENLLSPDEKAAVSGLLKLSQGAVIHSK